MSSSGRSGPGFLRRLHLRDVVLFTAPLFLAAMYLFVAGVLDYRKLRQFDDWWSRTARVDRAVWWRARAAWNLPRTLAHDQRLSVEDTTRASLDLRVDRTEFDRIANDPIGHAGESVQAEIWHGNEFEEVELRLRGDTSVHWSSEKKTLAIRSGRGEMFRGNRTTVFSVKEVLPQHVANSMAADFGLLAPPTAVVPVFLNQRFYGMTRSFSPVDETFLRNAKRIPGNIFRGDTAERGDAFKGLPRELFVNPYIWDRVAFNDRPGAIGTAKLFRFVAGVQRAESGEVVVDSELEQHLRWRAGRPDSVATEELLEILDRDEIARLLGLMLTVGDPWHISGVHNHFWYEDSSSGVLHPIPWDLRTLSLESPPEGANYNRFWRAVLRDPRIFAAALEAVHERRSALLANAEARLDDVLGRYADGFAYDALRTGPKPGGPNPEVGTREEVLRDLRGNLALLERWMGEARASIAATATDEGKGVVDILVDGRAGVSWKGFTLPGASSCQVYADTNRDGVLSLGDRELILQPGAESSFAMANDERLLPGVRPTTRLEIDPLHYRYFLRAPGADFTRFEVKLVNAVLGGEVRGGSLVMGSDLPTGKSLHPWSLLPSRTRMSGFLRGEEHLTRDLVIGAGESLHIEPGARIRLDPNVSIFSKGRVVAMGTEALPIVLEAADPLHPWGSFALWGDGASSSAFSHVHFSGGGGALLDEVEYTGMVCVHGARSVRFMDCEFTGNLRCDDALHADVAEVSLLRCWFHDTNADAVDYDMSGGVIQDCRVERAGNDGFDLMTCWPRLVNNQIRDNGDKGISVGEDSTPVIFANTITGCVRGIEVKDRSRPLILNNTITGNGIGVLARLKNWRYEHAGWPNLVRSKVTGNDTDFTRESGAPWTNLGTQLGGSDADLPVSGTDVSWVYALEGLRLSGDELGVPSAWTACKPASIPHFEEFPAIWRVPEETWTRAGGTTSLRYRDRCLVARFSTRPGSFARPVSIELGTTTGPHWLVLECAATQLSSARVTLKRAGDEAGPTAALELPAAGHPSFAYTVVPLPAGAYDGLTIEAVPRDTTARLYVHRWQVISSGAPEAPR